jgi:hypothetical protein
MYYEIEALEVQAPVFMETTDSRARSTKTRIETAQTPLRKREKVWAGDEQRTRPSRLDERTGEASLSGLFLNNCLLELKLFKFYYCVGPCS